MVSATAIPQYLTHTHVAGRDWARPLFEGDSGSIAWSWRQEEPPWRRAVRQRLESLLALPENWDSYGGLPIDEGLFQPVLEFLARFMRDQTPAPQIAPLSSGGVQLEWHTKGIDMEIAFADRRRLNAFFEDSKTGESWEEESCDALSALDSAFDRLTIR